MPVNTAPFPFNLTLSPLVGIVGKPGLQIRRKTHEEPAALS